MTDKGALRPEVFSLQGYIQDQKADQKGVSPEEQILATGASNPFWRTLKKHIDKELEALDAIQDTAIASGMPTEEIGRNAIVISQTKGVIKKIFNAVTDASEAVEEAHGNTE